MRSEFLIIHRELRIFLRNGRGVSPLREVVMCFISHSDSAHSPFPSLLSGVAVMLVTLTLRLAQVSEI